MADFVEKATLVLIDKTSAQAKKINNELNKLFSTASKLNGIGGNIKIGVTGAAVALTQVRKLNSELSKLTKVGAMPKLKVSVDSKQVLVAISRLKTLQAQANKTLPAVVIPANRLGRPPNTGGQAQSVGPQNVVPRQQRQQNFQPTARERRSEIIREGFSLIRNELRSVARNVIPTAGEGIMAGDDVNLRLRQFGMSVQQAAARQSEALKISTNSFSALSGAQIADSSIELAGLQTSSSAVTKVMMDMARSGTILAGVFKDTQKGSEEARQLGRVVSLQNLAQNPEKARELTDTITKAIIASGGDVTAGEARRMLQQMKGFGPGLSATGVSNLISFRDEGGKASTEEFRSFLNGLTRMNLNKRDMELQKKSGLRDAQGFTTTGNRATVDPIAFIQSEIMPALRKMGVDINDAASVRKGAAKLGFGQSESAAIIRVTLNSDQIDAENALKRKVDLEAGFDVSSLRNKLAEIDSQFQNAASGIAQAFLPAAKTAMTAVQTTLGAIATGVDRGEGVSAGDATKLGLALAGLGAVKTIQGMTSNDPSVKASSTAAFMLQTSAGALTLSAGALTTAAGVQSLASSGIKSTLAKLAFNPATLGALAVGGIAWAAMDKKQRTESNDPEIQKENLRDVQSRIDTDAKAVADAKSFLEKAKASTGRNKNRDIAFAEDRLKAVEQSVVDNTAEKAAVEKRIEALNKHAEVLKNIADTENATNKKIEEAGGKIQETLNGMSAKGGVIDKDTKIQKASAFDSAKQNEEQTKQALQRAKDKIPLLFKALADADKPLKDSKGKTIKEKPEDKQKRKEKARQDIIANERTQQALDAELKTHAAAAAKHVVAKIFEEIQTNQTEKQKKEAEEKTLKEAMERKAAADKAAKDGKLGGAPREGQTSAEAGDFAKRIIQNAIPNMTETFKTSFDGAIKNGLDVGIKAGMSGGMKSGVEGAMPVVVERINGAFTAGGQKIGEAGNTLGENAANKLKGVGPEIGSSIASSVRSGLAGFTIGVNTGGATANTGNTRQDQNQ